MDHGVQRKRSRMRGSTTSARPSPPIGTTFTRRDDIPVRHAAPLSIALLIESDGPAGAETMMLQLAEALRDRGHVDRKSTRLNSSHLVISYAVFCLKKKKKTGLNQRHTRIITKLEFDELC